MLPVTVHGASSLPADNISLLVVVLSTRGFSPLPIPCNNCCLEWRLWVNWSLTDWFKGVIRAKVFLRCQAPWIGHPKFTVVLEIQDNSADGDHFLWLTSTMSGVWSLCPGFVSFCGFVGARPESAGEHLQLKEKRSGDRPRFGCTKKEKRVSAIHGQSCYLDLLLDMVLLSNYTW